MNIFDIHGSVMENYADYIQSFVNISDDEIREHVDNELKEGKLWPQPLLQFNPAYKLAGSADSFQDPPLNSELKTVLKNYKLYQHQVEAIRLGLNNKDFIVTSGTGSGKSLTYITTIFQQLFNQPTSPGVVGVIVYPMNALINSQTNALNKYKQDYEEQNGAGSFPITFGQYTGQEGEEKREGMKQNPPQILLTNYMMLELLLTREQENKICDAIYSNLQYLVFDELHTYRGRQGADVAMLIRRIRAMCENEPTCIGTSATMISAGDTAAQRKQVADVASKFFGKPFEPDQIVQETLTRSLNHPEPVSKQALTEALDPEKIDIHKPKEALQQHPLAIWLENQVALEEQNGTLLRRKPSTVKAIIDRLTAITGKSDETCKACLEKMVLWISKVNQDIKTGGSIYTILPYKLHQFISQSGSVYTTLAPAGENRFITLEPGVYKSDERQKPIYPNVFSRTSGCPFICVKRGEDKFEPREFQIRLDKNEENEEGYLLTDPKAWDPQTDMENLPTSWVNKTKTGYKANKTHRAFFPEKVYYNEYGEYATSSKSHLPFEGWFMRAPLQFDPTGGSTYDARTSEATKLSKLGSEGRSTSTTITTFSILNQLYKNEVKLKEQKLLSFTDNRQDAALQAGHFNNFAQIIKLRSAIYNAVVKQQGTPLKYANIGQRIFDTLQLDISQYASTTTQRLFAHVRLKYENYFKDYLTYKALEDLRRSWRIVLPNLEQCALLKIQYEGLDEVASDEAYWEDMPFLSEMTQIDRKRFLQNLLDFFRYEYAINSEKYLTDSALKENAELFAQNLKSPWTLDSDEELLRPSYARLEPLHWRSRYKPASISKTSGFGKYIQQTAKENNVDMSMFKGEGYNAFIMSLMEKLEGADWIRKENAKNKDNQQTFVYRLNINSILWTPGDEKNASFDVTKQRTYKPTNKTQQKPNSFFQELYKTHLTGDRQLRAQDHTGQLTNEDRQEREERFRAEWYIDGDINRPDTKRIREEAINALFCSPTMELGVDIGGLSVVHMRNAPPNPANYAQRSGRAGRSGQGALVFTYCSGYSPHDRHYFLNQTELVAGNVQPPRIDLCNMELLITHLHALTISEIGLPGLTTKAENTNGSSLEQLVEMQEENRPLSRSIKEHLKKKTEKRQNIISTFNRVVKDFAEDIALHPSIRFSNEWIDRKLDKLEQNLDEALERWRNLFKKAEQLRERASQELNSGLYNTISKEYKNAERDLYYANRQIELICNINSRHSQLSEFYPYRYLASEGFLPGYNFTRLPIRVFIPNSSTGGEYISRPKHIALREFGPLNIIYYNGQKYKVKQLIAQNIEESLFKAKVATPSGYFLIGKDEDREFCPFSGADLSKSRNKTMVHDLLELSESRTEASERITCEEEERTSRGFEISTYFYVEGGDQSVRNATAKNDDDSFLRLRYVPAARLVYVSKGWRSQKTEGFPINTITGNWRTHMPNEDDGIQDPEKYKLVRLITTNTADSLYIEPIQVLGLEPEGVITLQYALKRAIEKEYQVETNELGVVNIGDPENPNILLYESAEGSLGILSQVVEDVEAFPRIIKSAIEICRYGDQHYKAPASYDDLLSYYNQPHHQIIDRFLIQEPLEKLSNCTIAIEHSEAFENYEAQYQYLIKNLDPKSITEKRFVDYLYKNKLRLPDHAQKSVDGLYIRPDFFYAPRTWVFIDGKPHDKTAVREDDTRKRQQLRNRGDEVWSWHYRENLEEKIAERPDIFKKMIGGQNE
mgnify:CR=1 FL=1